MMSQIHQSSFLSKNVKLGQNIKIGPFCYLDGEINIGDNTELKSHVVISGNVSIGNNNIFYPFSNIGCEPQDLKFNGEDSELIIGNNNIFRENTTISKGTRDGGMKTVIKNNNLFMTGVHIAHDCKIGNENIFVNQVTLAGHVNIINNVVIGGLSAIIQFVTIGSYSMIGGMSGIDKNVLPFSLAIGNRAKLRGLNLVGIRRKGFDKSEITRINYIHNQYLDGIDLDRDKKVDSIFLDYNEILNQNSTLHHNDITPLFGAGGPSSQLLVVPPAQFTGDGDPRRGQGPSPRHSLGPSHGEAGGAAPGAAADPRGGQAPGP